MLLALMLVLSQYLSMEEVRDMKLKSRMMQVDGGSASLNITLEATDNLGITSPTWSPIPENKVVIHPNFQNGKIRIDVDGDDNTNVRAPNSIVLKWMINQFLALTKD